MPIVNILVRQGIASAVHPGSAVDDAAQDLLRAVDELGVSLEPMHPGVHDSTLASYFTVDVSDGTKAQQLINRLQACEAVEAAYMKPPDALP